MTRTEAVNKLLLWCAAQVGNHEGANNWNKYADDPLLRQLLGWSPQNQPWCDLFTDDAFLQCFGLKATSEMTYQPIGRGSALCKTSAQFFKDNGAFVQAPNPGDVVFFYVGGDINHQGIVERVESGRIYTIEGNSSDTVARRNYSISDKSRIAGYGRPKWSVVTDGGEEDDTSSGADAPPSPQGEGNDGEVVTVAVGLPVLAKGDTGEAVKALQAVLIARGFSCGWWGADGDFGDGTDKAVRKFQERNGLEVDGIVGRETWRKLMNG